jgi:hypothetical protein
MERTALLTPRIDHGTSGSGVQRPDSRTTTRTASNPQIARNAGRGQSVLERTFSGRLARDANGAAPGGTAPPPRQAVATQPVGIVGHLGLARARQRGYAGPPGDTLQPKID